MPLYTAGQKIRASELNALPQIYYVTSQLTKNNSIALGNVTGLAFTAAASTRYFVETFIVYASPTARDIRLAWSVPAGTTGWFAANGTESGAVGQAGSNNHGVGALTDAHGFTGDAAVDVICMPTAYVLTGGTAGTVQLQFAQLSAGASDTVIRAGSSMRVTQLV